MLDTFHIMFMFLSHFWARDPDPGFKNHMFVIFLVILFSYDFHIFVYAWPGPPVHTAIFENGAHATQNCYQMATQRGARPAGHPTWAKHSQQNVPQPPSKSLLKGTHPPPLPPLAFSSRGRSTPRAPPHQPGVGDLPRRRRIRPGGVFPLRVDRHI